MSSPTLAGTGTLLRFAVRRDRVRLPVWVLAGAALFWVPTVRGSDPT